MVQIIIEVYLRYLENTQIQAFMELIMWAMACAKLYISAGTRIGLQLSRIYFLNFAK